MELLTQNYLTRGFWGDEAWTALISQLPLTEILRVTGEDFHPPLYYFLVHFWGQLFGFGEITIRLFSLFFFLLTPIVTYFLVNKFFKNTAQSLTTALLVFLSPIFFTYAFESRSYALLAFLTISSAFVFWQARTHKGHRYKFLYFLIGTISVYTHYYAWFILASHGFYLLLFERNRIKKLLIPAVSILIAQLPWIPTLLGQLGEVNRDYWIAPMNHRTHWEFFLRVAGGDTQTLFQHSTALFILFLIAITVYLTYSSRKNSHRPHVNFLLTWLIIPTLLPSLISLVTPVFFYRYLIFSAIPILILATYALFRLPKKVWLIGTISLSLQYILINHQTFSRYPDSMRQKISDLYQIKTPGDSPVYTVLPSFAEVAYYIKDTDDLKVLDKGIVQFSGKSLLDSFVRSGKVEIVDPPTQPYWFLEPGPKINLITPEVQP